MYVKKSTSNSAVWGECGRYPLSVSLAKLVFNYKERLIRLKTKTVLAWCVSRHAYREQKNFQLNWYKSLDNVQQALESEEKKNSEKIQPDPGSDEMLVPES
jgi:hypothetical protein